MVERISRADLYINSALLVALRGTCARAQVGCVIVKDGRIISSGYNGALGKHDCTQTCNISESCKKAIHAEANAIYFAANKGISLEGASLYCSHSPCIKCAEAIIQAGIQKVVYLETYKDTEPLEILGYAGVEVSQHIKPDIRVITGLK
jgi:dCMP deaminase